MEQKETLIIEVGKFTGKLGLEVYEQFKREVDDKWKKLQQTQIRKSSALQSRKAVEEDIIVKALDGFSTQLSAKERLEMQTGLNISNIIWKVLVHVDEDYLLVNLRTMCREGNLPVNGDKHLLSWRLLEHEVMQSRESKKQFEMREDFYACYNKRFK